MTDNEQTGGASELDVLKQRARLLGITFSNNIGLEALRERVNAKISADEAEASEDVADDDAEQTDEVNALEATAEVADAKDTVPAGTVTEPGYKPQLDHDHDGYNGGSLPHVHTATVTTPVAPTPAPSPRKLTPQEQKMKDRADLIKEQMKLVRCRIQNLDPKKAELPGEIFTVANRILGTVRKYVPYGEVTDNGYHLPYIIYKQLEDRRFLNIRTSTKNGQVRVESNWAKEFAIEVLPPLTQEELDRLAAAQAAAGNGND